MKRQFFSVFLIVFLLAGFLAAISFFIPHVYGSTETRYMRSDTQTVNSLNAYVLGTSQTPSSANVQTSIAVLNATVRSNAVGTNTNIPNVSPGGTAHWNAESDQNDSTYVYSSAVDTTSYEDTYAHSNFTLPSGYSIAYVRVYVRGVGTGHGSGYRSVLYISSTTYQSSLYTGTSTANQYTDYGTNPYTGSAWTQTTVNQMQSGCIVKSSLFSSVYYVADVFECWFEIYIYDDPAVYYSISVAQRTSAGSETALGTNVAQYSSAFNSITAGLKSATWACPQTTFASTDSLVVRVYEQTNTSGWVLIATFTTEQLGASYLNSSTWTVYYYLSTSTYNVAYSWDTGSYQSRIENFTWTTASATSSGGWQVSADMDNGEDQGIFPSYTVFYNGTGWTDEYIGNVGGTHCGRGDRFLSVGIPQGVNIIAATEMFYSNVAKSGTTCNLKITGEKSANAATFSTVANLNSRNRTSAVAAWNSVPAWSVATWYTTVDFTSVMQEIVNQATWISGNAVVIYVDDNGSSASAYREPAEHGLGANYAAKLNVTWTTPSGADTTPPTYYNVNVNTTVRAAAANFSIVVSDNVTLHPNGQYLFGCNNTGSWVNETAGNFTATPQGESFVKTLNANIGVLVTYEWWLTDNAGNKNDTGVLNFTVTAVALSFSGVCTLTQTVSGSTAETMNIGGLSILASSTTATRTISFSITGISAENFLILGGKSVFIVLSGLSIETVTVAETKSVLFNLSGLSMEGYAVSATQSFLWSLQGLNIENFNASASHAFTWALNGISIINFTVGPPPQTLLAPLDYLEPFALLFVFGLVFAVYFMSGRKREKPA